MLKHVFVGAVTCLAAAFLAVAPRAATPVPNVPGSWKLVFSDEFSSKTVNREKWTLCYWWDKSGCTNLGNNELEWYLPGNVSQARGKLNMDARKQSVIGWKGQTFPYTSGMVTTGRDYSETRAARAQFTYGHIEIKAKIPRGKGLWPALWLLPSTLKSLPEIDIMEVLGDTPQQLHLHFHYLDAGGKAQQPGETVTTVDLSAGWHVYGLTWDPDVIRWYLDGKEVWSFTDKRYIPSAPMYLLMNLAVGGDWPGAPNALTKFPSRFSVDYVRVWQRTTQ
ncbi:family 16 glycosylhydrolase [Aestuariivirga sp.]|uniref:glycoside hydrolase family 16 protein n=1 Tax=Aestuariivirga sp. TaxID=2650926 RepID=UPI0035AEEB5C